MSVNKSLRLSTWTNAVNEVNLGQRVYTIRALKNLFMPLSHKQVSLHYKNLGSCLHSNLQGVIITPLEGLI